PQGDERPRRGGVPAPGMVGEVARADLSTSADRDAPHVPPARATSGTLGSVVRGLLLVLLALAGCSSSIPDDTDGGSPCGAVRCAPDQECLDGACIPRG